jgi:hypothetical protein
MVFVLAMRCQRDAGYKHPTLKGRAAVILYPWDICRLSLDSPSANSSALTTTQKGYFAVRSQILRAPGV